MAANVVTALDIEPGDDAMAEALRLVKWEERITLTVRNGDNFVRTPCGAIRVPTVIVAVNCARVPQKRPKLSVKNIRDRTAVVIVSDHGGKRIDGGIAVNEWLIREGYLSVAEYPQQPKALGKLIAENKVNWSATKAWSEGVIVRVFLNVKGREPQGVIEPKDYEAVRDELIRKLQALGDENGKPIGTRVYRPEKLYAKCNGVWPDLVVIFGELYWRSIGSIGYHAIHVFENDTGPDDANHAQDAMFMLTAPGLKPGNIPPLDILDVTPTLLKLYGMAIPPDMQGKPLAAVD